MNMRKFRSLADEDRPVIPTDCAAYYLNRSAQTLRIWACKQNGPIQPLRVNGRLAWRTNEIRRLVGEQEVVCA